MRPPNGKATRRAARRAWRGHPHPHQVLVPRHRFVRLDRRAPNPRIPWLVTPGDGTRPWHAVTQEGAWLQLAAHQAHRNNQPV